MNSELSEHYLPLSSPLPPMVGFGDNLQSDRTLPLGLLCTPSQLQKPCILPQTTEIWGTRFARLTMDKTVQLVDDIVHYRRPAYLVTANLNYLMLTREHPRLEEVNRGAAAVIADGHPIVWRSKVSLNPLPGRVAGADLIVELAQLSAARGYRIFFLGGSPGVAQAAADVLRNRFPTLQVAGCYSPPFRPLNSAEHQSLIYRIKNAGTDILLVAFGQPKGEFWIYDHLHELQVPLSIQLGASFDFLAGTAKRAPKFWQRLGCEWLYRTLQDPVRLVPRYFRNGLFLLGALAGDLFPIYRARWDADR